MNYRLILVKKNKRWLWTVVNHFSPGILAWRLGDRSADTFEPLWQMIRGWQSFFYVTDGWLVYPRFINDCDHLVLKTYMTSDPASPKGARLNRICKAVSFRTTAQPSCICKAVSMIDNGKGTREC